MFFIIKEVYFYCEVASALVELDIEKLSETEVLSNAEKHLVRESIITWRNLETRRFFITLGTCLKLSRNFQRVSLPPFPLI